MPSLVSIIIPTYNRTRWLAQAIESALGQSHDPVEVIVVDDGSTTDESHAVTRRYPSVKYLYQPNTGLGAARNAGYVASSGEFILFLDDDDWLTPNAIAEKLDALTASPAKVGAVYSDSYLINSDDTMLGRYHDSYPHPLPGGDLYVSLLRHNFIPVHTLLWRRAALETTKVFPTWSGAEDWYLLVQMAEQFHFRYIDQPHGAYRIHRTNMTRKKEQQTLGYAQVQKMVTTSVRFHGLPPTIQASVLARYATTQMLDGDEILGKAYLKQACEIAPNYVLARALNVMAVNRSLFRVLIHWSERLRSRLRLVPTASAVFLADG